MYALSKTPVTRATAQTLLTAHCGSHATIDQYTELTDGMYNAAYLITLTDGQKLVLKVAPPDHVKVLRYERNIMRAEVETLRLVRANTTVPVPEIFAYDTSRRLLDNDYFLMSFVPGVSLHKLRPQLTADEQHAIDRQTGDYLQQINAIAGPRFGYVAQPASHRATWRETFAAMLEQVLQDGRDAAVTLPIDYDELAAQLQPVYGALDAVTQPVLVHWDLWDGNIFVDPATKTITGLIDFERALWGDPLMEVNFGAFGVNPALVEGYGVDLLVSPNAQIRRTLYNIYLWLIMLIECTYRQYETADQANWVRPKLIADLQRLTEFDDHRHVFQ
jgi:aminoglycoside phosphotransferase (APT) family kinase protein